MVATLVTVDKVEYYELPCLVVTQPLGEFYIASIDSNVLAEISRTDVRKLVDGTDDFLGIQRVLIDKRVKEIKEYVGRVDAVFPTGVIVNVGDEDGYFDPKTSTIRIRRSPDVVQILDGQHRLAGLRESELSFELNISIFVGLDVEDQASVFATINLAQAKVNKSLVYDLFEYSQIRSPQRTAHRVVVALDRDDGSRLRGRIKRLGSSGGDPQRTVTQAVVVESILRLLTSNPGRDRDRVRRGEALKEGEYDAAKFPLWPIFVNGKDADIRDIVRAFFNAVAAKWPDAWDAKDGSILCRTSGIKSFMRALGHFLTLRPTNETALECANRIVNQFNVSDPTFSRETYLPGSAGESKLIAELTGTASTPVD